MSNSGSSGIRTHTDSAELVLHSYLRQTQPRPVNTPILKYLYDARHLSTGSGLNNQQLNTLFLKGNSSSRLKRPRFHRISCAGSRNRTYVWGLGLLLSNPSNVNAICKGAIKEPPS